MNSAASASAEGNVTSAKRIDVDVVVIGGGGSGLAAAIEAAERGRSVVLAEKNEELGGSTAWSIGSLSASNTPHQRRKGILDSPDDHFEDMAKFRELSKRIRNSPRPVPNNLALRRLFVDNVPDTVSWLVSMGVEFYGPLPEMPHRKPRQLIVVPNSKAYIYNLRRAALKRGVDIRTSTRAKKLIMEGDQVVGVLCDTPNGPVEFRTRGGVVLATGDFAANPEMRAKFLPPMAQAVPTNPTATGDGHLMVEEIGGRIVDTTLQSAGVRFQPPPWKWIFLMPPHPFFTRLMIWGMDHLPGWLIRPFVVAQMTTLTVPSPYLFKYGSILINKLGERFTDEMTNPGDSARPALTGQPDGLGYIVMDKKIGEKFSHYPSYVSTAPGIAYAYIPDYRRARKDIFREASTLAGLARKLDIPAATLEKTVADFNASLSSSDKEAGRLPLDTGPYIAMGPVRHYLNFADSGVAVSDRLEVLTADGKVIPGLYAAGFIGMGGATFQGHGHHIGWAFTSGRLAGRYAAYRAVTEDPPLDHSHVYQ